VLIQT